MSSATLTPSAPAASPPAAPRPFAPPPAATRPADPLLSAALLPTLLGFALPNLLPMLATALAAIAETA